MLHHYFSFEKQIDSGCLEGIYNFKNTNVESKTLITCYYFNFYTVSGH
jgi:hypothetical protein